MTADWRRPIDAFVWTRTASIALLTVLLMSVSVVRVMTGGALEDAVALYRAAQYNEALEILQGLSADGAVSDARELDTVAEYRALCLLALDRGSEARSVVQGLLERHPDYRAQSGELPPRFLALVSETRANVWPTLVRAEYRSGKDSYDRKAYGEAEKHFRKVTVMLANDSEVDAAVRQSLADVGELAKGFLTLIASASVQPVPALPPPSAAATPTPSTEAASGAAGAAPETASGVAGAAPRSTPAVYTATDVGVTPPVPLNQELPLWRATGAEGQLLRAKRGKGVLEILIDASGQVEQAHLQSPVHPIYDGRLLAAARKWTYRPATRDGVPVRYRKIIEIQLVDPQ